MGHFLRARATRAHGQATVFAYGPLLPLASSIHSRPDRSTPQTDRAARPGGGDPRRRRAVAWRGRPDPAEEGEAGPRQRGCWAQGAPQRQAAGRRSATLTAPIAASL